MKTVNIFLHRVPWSLIDYYNKLLLGIKCINIVLKYCGFYDCVKAFFTVKTIYTWKYFFMQFSHIIFFILKLKFMNLKK